MHNQQNRNGNELERVNLMLKRDDSAWLDRLANEIRANTGVNVSRSEIVRAALSTMAELHRLALTATPHLFSLAACKSEGELTVAGILAVRSAVVR
jgi:hypothetical protein